MPKWSMKAVEISGGFLAGLSLELPEGLTCIIGPRGSGKSTLFEAIRCAVLGTRGLPPGRTALVKSNLANAAISIGTRAGPGLPAYTVRRVVGQNGVLVTSDSKAVEGVDLDRGTFLPLDAYGGSEIESIAEEALGEKRRALLDDLRGEDLHAARSVLAELRRELERNADATRGTERRSADLRERLEELADAEARLAALPATGPHEGASVLTAAARRERANAAVIQGIGRASSHLAEIATSLRDQSSQNRPRVSLSELTTVPEETESLRRADSAYREALNAISGHFDAALVELEAAQGKITGSASELRGAHAVFEAEIVELKRRHEAADQAVRLRAAAEQAVATLQQVRVDLKDADLELAKLREQRKELKAKYLLQRDRITAIREDAAAALCAKAGTKVRVRVLRNADTLAYSQRLMEGLRGAGVKNHDAIVTALLRLRPEQLAQIILDGDEDELCSASGLGAERCRKVLDAFKSTIDPLALEIVDIDDRVCLELDVAADTGKPLFKDASELSQGQKCTSLLPVLLARRDAPLLIDQPEDNLDNRFVYETVVKAIERLKSTRQMIFVTHNANIPVLADADLIVVLGSDGSRGFVQKTGSVDTCKAEIVDLLEGGKDAFQRRRARYGTA